MKVLALVILFLQTSTFARDWVKIKIPGAKCGDSLDYFVFYNPKNSKKLFAEFMGGGACWNLSTCFGPNLRTWMHPIPEIPAFSVLTSDNGELTPFNKHSALYFPYCTGDVHAGDHAIDYRFNIRAHHRGYSNIQKSLKYLKENEIIQFKDLDEVILFGASAGAIGSLLHTKTITPYLGTQTKKYLISDSPGLHFGQNFWDKFTSEMIHDFDRNFSKVDLNIDFSDGMIASEIEHVCHYLSDWKVGILQGSQDLVMSKVFGNISPQLHREYVYSDAGIFETSKKNSNCAAFTPDTKMHTFLLIEKSARIQAGGIDALEFVKRIYSGQTSRSFK
ncbi:hypothetical protein BIY24_09035 [Halobacteriovorax marinus]|uniref:pectin acetylesterase-family hydrolase n=1 Tax=Halobacteriovorax marinus TaxID=97084 RepID=UPI000BC2F139|nr:pectin acetylesterase-family hydrolase [Halobacteriovorax marinus]ATH08088.1 hypothetical protein BIY24_09035 [Halobacteriovorax marinus]